MSKLTELDIKHISKLIGKEANEFELSLIENVLKDELKKRNYLEIIGRLNKGVKRNPKAQAQIAENYILKAFNSLKIYSDKKEVHREGDSQNKSDEINSGKYLIAHGSEIIGESLRNSFGKLSDYNSVEFRIDDNSEKQIIFKTKLDIIKNSIESELDLADSIVFKIDIGNDNKKNRNILNTFLKSTKSDRLFTSARIVSKLGVSSTLINELEELKCGIIIDKKVSLDILLEHKSLSLLVIASSSNSAKIKRICSNNNLKITLLGSVNYDRSFQLETKDYIINLPMSVFDLQFDVNTKHFEQPQIENYKSTELIKNAKRSSYSSQLLRLFEKITLNNQLISSATKISQTYGFEINSNDFDQLVAVASADNNNLLMAAPRTSAKVSVANAARKMSCMGIKPQFASIHNLFPFDNKLTNWYASELLQGQEEAVRELDLTILDRRISTFNNSWQQNVSVIGIGKNISNSNIRFKDDADFISLLGSHRGELIGTEYNRYINDKVNSTVPTVDLNMERRLQDVVQQGISTKLLKSATNVSMGGISIAVAMSLAVSKPGIGAKIHLSRKLTNEELLFGETQGLVIVTLSEEDIMEFERICMSVGVPSTTIGRVTNNNQYTFNDMISINAEKLRKLSN